MTEPDYKGILLSLCKSLSLAENLGDVEEAVLEALKQTNMTFPNYEEFADLYDFLNAMGIPGLWERKP